MALQVGELFASFNLDTKGLGGSIKGIEKQLSGIGSGMMMTGAALTAAITRPLINAAKAVYRNGTEFDAQMSKVFAIIGDEATGSEEVMQGLIDKAQDMGATTKFTMTEAGEAMQYMAMAGWDVKDIMKGVAPLMNLAAASGENLGTTSDIVTDAMTAFGMSAKDNWKVLSDGQWVDTGINNVEHFTDVLAAASSNSNTNVAMMGESFKYAAPLAGSLGYSVDDVALALGLMANSGVKASMAGTSVSRIIQNMMNPATEDAAAAMDALGVSLMNDRGEYKSFREVMTDFRSAASAHRAETDAMTASVADLTAQYDAGQITEAQYEASLSELTGGAGDFMKMVSKIAGARGLPGLLAIMNASDDDFNKLASAIDNANGTADTMAETMLDNVEGAYTLMKSSLSGLSYEFWKLSKDSVRGAIDQIKNWSEALRTADDETKKGVYNTAKLAAALGPALTGVGLGIKLLPYLGKALTFAASPMGLLAVSALALGAAMMDTENTIGHLTEKTLAMVEDKLKTFAEDFKKRRGEFRKDMANFLDSLRTVIRDNLPGILQSAHEILQTFIDAITSGLPGAGAVGRQLVTTLATHISDNADDITASAAKLVHKLLVELIKSVPTLVKGGAMIASSLLQGLSKINWEKYGKSLNLNLRKALTKTKTELTRMLFGDENTDPDPTWGEIGQKLVEAVWGGIQTAGKGLRDWVGGLLLGNEYKAEDDFATFGKKLVDKLFDGGDEGLSGAADFVSGILDGLGEVFSAANIEGAAESLKGILERIVTRTIEEIPKLEGYAGQILGKLGELIMGRDGQGGLLSSTIDGATTLAQGIFEALATALSGGGLGAEGETIGKKLLAVIQDAFSEKNVRKLTGSLTDLMKAVFGGLATVIPGLTGEAANLITAIGAALFEPGEGEEQSLTATALAALRGVVLELMRGVNTLLPSMTEGAVGLINAIATWFDLKHLDELKPHLNALISQVFILMDSVIRGMGKSASGILTALGEALFSTDENGESTVTYMAQFLGDIMERVFTSLSTQIIPGMGTAAKDVLDAITNTLFKPDANGNTGLSQGVTALKTLVGKVFDGLINDVLPSMGNEAAGLIAKIGEVLFGTGEEGGAITQGTTALSDLLRTVLTKSAELVTGLGAEGLKVFQALIDAVFGKDQEGKIKSADALDSISKLVTDVLGELPGIISGLGTDVLSPIMTAISGVLTKENMTALGLSWGGLGASIITGIGDAIASIFETVADLADQAAEDLGKDDGPVGAVKSGLSAFMERIMEAVATTLPKLVASGGKLLGSLGKLAVNLLTAIGDALFETGEGETGLTTEALDGLKGIFENTMQALADALPGLLEAGGALLTSLGKIGTRLLKGIGEALFRTGEGEKTLTAEALEGAGDLARDLGQALAQGIRDNADALAETGIGEALIDAIAGVFRTLPSVIDAATGAIEGGAAIANAIIESIANGLTELLNSDASTAFNDFAGRLPQTLFQAVGDLTGNADVQGFLRNLGTALHDGLSFVGEGLGSFIGGLINLLFTPEGLTQLWDTAKNVGAFIQEAIFAGLNGLSGLITGIIDGILDELGIIDLDKRKEIHNLNKLLTQSVFPDGKDWSNVAADSEEGFNAAILGLFGNADLIEKTGNTELNNAWESVWSHFSFGEEVTSDNLKSWFKEAGFEKSIEGLPDLFWESLANSWNAEDKNQGNADFMSYLLTNFFSIDPNDIPEGDGMQEVYKRLFGENPETPAAEAGDTAGETFVESLNNASESGQAGFETAVKNELPKVEGAAAEAGDAAVKTFLLTMSAGNGATIGVNFMTGIVEGLQGWDYAAFTAGQSFAAMMGIGIQAGGVDAVTEAATLKINITTAISGLSDVGSTAGNSFGTGLANGISAMTSIVTTAASGLGAAAAAALRAALGIASPSKETFAIGEFFDQGFITGIENLNGYAEDAAEALGLNSLDSLSRAGERMGDMAVSQTQLPAAGGRQAMGSVPDRFDPYAIQEVAGVLSSALSGVQVNMDSQPVGQMTAPTVSRAIAGRATRKRSATIV